MNDLPRRAVTRTVKLAALPAGLAGRTVLGIGKRVGGRPAEIVAQEIQQRTAEQIFRVLGELKGGALKLGQALSIFEAALPPELAGPYRATLTMLQESAPPLPASTVHKVLAADLGEDWRDKFAEFDDRPAAAASIGQVHKAVWHDGRQVAVKIQYPGAGKALASDFAQISRLGRLFGVLMPGLDVKPLLDEIIAEGTQDQRDRAGLLLVRLLFSSPARAGLLHADPHPGNFRLLDDGRLGVLDFGAVDRLPEGLPPLFGRLLWLVHTDGDIAEAEAELREHGFLRPGVNVDLEALRSFLAPLADPSRQESFTFSREWMRGEAARVTDLRGASVARQLNLPPSYILIHRTSTAGIGVLCQLGSHGNFRAEVLRWMPGYGPADIPGSEPAGAPVKDAHDLAGEPADPLQ